MLLGLEQAHILDRDYGLVGKNTQEPDFPFGEWPDLKTAYRECADSLVFSYKWNGQNRAMTQLTSHFATDREVLGASLEIVDVDGGAIHDGSSNHPVTSYRPVSTTSISNRDRPIVGSERELIRLAQRDNGIVRLTQSRRPLDQRIKYRLEVEAGSANKVENVSSCCLLFARLTQLATKLRDFASMATIG